MYRLCVNASWRLYLFRTALFAAMKRALETIPRLRRLPRQPQASANLSLKARSLTTQPPRQPEPEPRGRQWTGKWDQRLNAANAITTARMCSAPVLGNWIMTGNLDAALLGLVVAGASDVLDGYLARHHGMSTVLGSYLDPLSDKIMLLCVYGALGATGLAPLHVAGIVIGRDVIQIGASFALRGSDIGAIVSAQPERDALAKPLTVTAISKLNTALQIAFALLVLVDGSTRTRAWLSTTWGGAQDDPANKVSAGREETKKDNKELLDWLGNAVAVSTIAAGASYVVPALLRRRRVRV
ncbi:Cardiolipin synthase (CMP-forming) [Porphyridium purpureum]|uniref:Cardiolipin synthase (CMP-forming) n=1 Tax=Porphyridium purpureum TaxID=35688 RepID=A0A5J4Z756_PORPP|nr:Cardiolipin synthase (CMP-forming) [Porphyridium purpureum]|eukprot:POR5342..scf295_1